MNDDTSAVRAPVSVGTASSPSSPRFDSVHPTYRGSVTDRPAGLSNLTTGEDLIADARGNLTPAQMVERKLVQLLRGNPLPVSHMLNKARR
jgi:hypothetical protein